jgi:hypothetical protein
MIATKAARMTKKLAEDLIMEIGVRERLKGSSTDRLDLAG